MSKLYSPGIRSLDPYRIIAAILVSLLLSACAVDEEDTSPLRVRSVGIVLGLTGDPTTDRTLPAISDPRAQLGMKLFFSKALSGDELVACASCHHPVLAGGDALSLPIGVGAVDPNVVGPGRLHILGSPTVPRNAPTTFNSGLLDQVMFLDGRVESLDKFINVNGDPGDTGIGIATPDSDLDDNGDRLADPNAGDNLPTAQSRFQVTDDEAMRGVTFPSADPTNDEVRTALTERLALDSENAWDTEFTAAYGDATITYERIAEAIGEYERSQVFVNNPWKTFMEGDDTAISAAARRGALLFMLPTRVDGASCLTCHRGDRFTDERFHVLGMPQVGPGNGDGATGDDDFARFRVTGTDNDTYAFRTPSLLNVTETGPWGHAGAYTTLEAVIRHHLDPQAAFDNYDFDQLDASIQTENIQTNTQAALDKLAANELAGLSLLPEVSLTDAEISDLIEFLNTLTDPCIKDRACLAPWIPDTATANPALNLLEATDGSGNPL